MKRISEWYTELSFCSFSTIFIPLNEEELQALLKKKTVIPENSSLVRKVERASQSILGRYIIACDSCFPSDIQKKSFSKARLAVNELKKSKKVCEHLSQKLSNKLLIRPYRRMDKAREFRLFIYKKKIIAMSQYHIKNYYKKILDKKDFFWKQAKDFVLSIKEFLKEENIVIDIYFTAKGRIIIIDLNSWGEETKPLLLNRWDRDWTKTLGLKLILPPKIKVKGEISLDC